MSVKDTDLSTSEVRDPRKDFDDLLELARDLQDDCDRSSQRVLMYRMAAGALVVACIAFPLFLGITPGFTERIAAYAVSGALVGLAYAVLVELVLVRKMSQRLRRDQRALSEVVELLRAAERSIAEREDLSALERAKLRVQFSRFDI